MGLTLRSVFCVEQSERTPQPHPIWIPPPLRCYSRDCPTMRWSPSSNCQITTHTAAAGDKHSKPANGAQHSALHDSTANTPLIRSLCPRLFLLCSLPPVTHSLLCCVC